MQDFIMNIMNQYGYFGIFFLIVVENIFPPIPSEVILLFGGALTNYTRLEVFEVILYSTLGSLVGAYILYIIGNLLNKDRLKKIVSGKIGKILKLKIDDIDKADLWFNENGNLAVFFCRFIPIVRSLISIPAGMSSMPIFKFTIYTIIGTIIWNTVLVSLGSIMGENWSKIVFIFKDYSIVIKVILISLVIFTIFKIYFKRKK